MKTTITLGLRTLFLVILMVIITLVTPRVNAQNNFITGPSGADIDQVAYSQQGNNIMNMVIFPRPTHDIVNVQAQATTSSNVNLTVMDILGRIIMERTELIPQGPFNYRLDLSHFPNGMYVLEIRSGSEIISTKLIKD